MFGGGHNDLTYFWVHEYILASYVVTTPIALTMFLLTLLNITGLAGYFVILLAITNVCDLVFYDRRVLLLLLKNFDFLYTCTNVIAIFVIFMLVDDTNLPMYIAALVNCLYFAMIDARPYYKSFRLKWVLVVDKVLYACWVIGWSVILCLSHFNALSRLNHFQIQVLYGEYNSKSILNGCLANLALFAGKGLYRLLWRRHFFIMLNALVSREAYEIGDNVPLDRISTDKQFQSSNASPLSILPL